MIQILDKYVGTFYCRDGQSIRDYAYSIFFRTRYSVSVPAYLIALDMKTTSPKKLLELKSTNPFTVRKFLIVCWAKPNLCVKWLYLMVKIMWFCQKVYVFNFYNYNTKGKLWCVTYFFRLFACKSASEYCIYSRLHTYAMGL